MGMITNPAKRKSYNCYSGGICYLLERKGTLLSEHTSFGLSAGLNFEVHVEDSLSFRAVRELHCLTDFISSLSVEVLEYPEHDFVSFANKTKEIIDTDMPVMAEYDGFYFPFTQIFQKKHEKRIAMIIGYDQDNFYVSDFIYSAYEAPVSYELFEQAVTLSKGACISPKWYDVNVPEKINEKITSNLALKSINDVSTYFLIEGVSDNRKMVGIEGIKIFSEVIKELMQPSSSIKVDWAIFSEDIKQAVITFRHYGDFIEDMLINNLIDASKENTQKIQMLFHDASLSWRTISNLIFKYSLTSKETLLLKISKQILDSSNFLEEAFLRINKDILQDKH
jgi:hypothetical protein